MVYGREQSPQFHNIHSNVGISFFRSRTLSEGASSPMLHVLRTAETTTKEKVQSIPFLRVPNNFVV